MAGTTTMRWTGQAGVVLTLPPGAALQDADIDLTASGATFAFVRLVPQTDDPACPSAFGPRCHAWQFDWIRAIYADAAYNGEPPARRHYAGVPNPAIWPYPKMDAYLFTDGSATLTMRWKGLRGSERLTPTGRFRGRAESVPVSCAPLGCDTSTGRSNGVMYGGDSFDLQGPGWVDVRSVFASDDLGEGPSTGTNNQVHDQAYCVYPNPSQPSASAAPADHPYGCGALPANSAEASNLAILVANQAASSVPSVATSYATYWSGARGAVYFGFRANGAGPNPSHAQGYGVWFRYGIR